MTDPSKLAPFFRIPGLLRAEGVEEPSDLARHPGLGRRFPGRRLAACVIRPCLSARNPAARGQGQGHSAPARHPGPHRCRAAQDHPRSESTRLSHRPCRACDRRPTSDADRAGGMAAASTVGERIADRALAGRAQIRVHADHDASGTEPRGSQRAASASAAVAAAEPRRRRMSRPPCPCPAAISSQSRKAQSRCCCPRRCRGVPRRGWPWRLRRLMRPQAQGRLSHRDAGRRMPCMAHRSTPRRPKAPHRVRPASPA